MKNSIFTFEYWELIVTRSTDKNFFLIFFMQSDNCVVYEVRMDSGPVVIKIIVSFGFGGKVSLANLYTLLGIHFLLKPFDPIHPSPWISVPRNISPNFLRILGNWNTFKYHERERERRDPTYSLSASQFISRIKLVLVTKFERRLCSIGSYSKFIVTIKKFCWKFSLYLKIFKFQFSKNNS